MDGLYAIRKKSTELQAQQDEVCPNNSYSYLGSIIHVSCFERV